MGRQRRKTVKKKSTSSPAHGNDSHQSKKQKVNDCSLDEIQVCANCCSSINSPISKTHETPSNFTQQQSSTCSSHARVDDPPGCDSDLNKMISTIYNLDFIPRLLQKYPDAVCEEIRQITEFPLCFICTTLLKPLFSLYSQFNQIRKIESIISKQIKSLNSLINYDGENQSQNEQLNQADDDPIEIPESNSSTRDIVNPQDTTTTTATTTNNSSSTGGSSRIESHSTDPEPRVWVEIEPLDDLTVEDIGYIPPSLRHLYRATSQGTPNPGRRQTRTNQSEINQQGTSASCHSNATKLACSSNDRGHWVKVGPRLEDVTIIEEVDPSHCPLTLPQLEDESPQRKIIISDVVSMAPAQDEDDEDNFVVNDIDDEPSILPHSDDHHDHDNDNDSDMDYEPSLSSLDDEDKVDDKHFSQQPEPVGSEDDDDVNSNATDIKPDLESSGEENEQEKQSVPEEKEQRSEKGNSDANTKNLSHLATKQTPGDGKKRWKEGEVEMCTEKGRGTGKRKHLCTVVDEAGKVIPYQEPEEKVKCGECDKVFNSSMTLKLHVKYMHSATESPKPFPCPTVLNKAGRVCPFRATTQHKLRLHMLTVHPVEKDKFKCDECKNVYKNPDNLKRHIRMMHTEKGRKKYEKTLEQNRERSKARTKESNANGFACPHCGLDFTMKQSFTVHLRTVHKDFTGAKPKVVPCKLCAKKFTHNAALKVHMQHTHSDARPFACEACRTSYKSKESLRNHQNRCHSEEGRQKDYARKRDYLQKKRMLREEEARKAGIEESVCPHCGIDFLTKVKCIMHRRSVHDDYTEAYNKVVMCDVCGKKFEGGYKLKIHMQHVHSNARPYICEECGRSYKSNQNLQTHKSRFHTEGGKQKYNEYQRANLQRKKLIKKQIARKEGDEMEAETETSEDDSESEHEQARETAVVTRSSASSSLLPPSSGSEQSLPTAPTID